MSSEMTKVSGPAEAASALLTLARRAGGRDVEGLAEASVGVVVDLAGVHDDADSQLTLLASGGGRPAL
jgi:hypothetical protein